MAFRKQSHRMLFVLALGLVLIGMTLGVKHVQGAELLLILAVGILMLAWACQWSQAGQPRSVARLVSTERLLAGWAADCEIIPRQDATTEQLKRLGTALALWWQTEGKDSARPATWIDQGAVNDLLAGELPQPFALRLLAEVNNQIVATGEIKTGTSTARISTRELREALQRARQVYPQLDRLIPQPDSRSVRLGLGARSEVERDRLIDGLRRALPKELVEDVLLHGQSWVASDL
jgi:hypothetical protein